MRQFWGSSLALLFGFLSCLVGVSEHVKGLTPRGQGKPPRAEPPRIELKKEGSSNLLDGIIFDPEDPVERARRYTVQRQLVVGIVAILGALSYRSLKRRRLGLKADTIRRRGVEIGLLIAAIATVGGQENLLSLIRYEPFSYLVVPIWALTAYGIVFLKKPIAGKAAAT